MLKNIVKIIDNTINVIPPANLYFQESIKIPTKTNEGIRCIKKPNKDNQDKPSAKESKANILINKM